MKLDALRTAPPPHLLTGIKHQLHSSMYWDARLRYCVQLASVLTSLICPELSDKSPTSLAPHIYKVRICLANIISCNSKYSPGLSSLQLNNSGESVCAQMNSNAFT